MIKEKDILEISKLYKTLKVAYKKKKIYKDF